MQTETLDSAQAFSHGLVQVHSVRIFVDSLATLAAFRAGTCDQTSKTNCTDAVDANTVVCGSQTAKRALDLVELLGEMARHCKLGFDN